jgi:hypothetical protein
MGLPSYRKIITIESRKRLEERSRHKKLHYFDSFNIICSLLFSFRVDIRDSFCTSSATSVEDKQHNSPSVASQESIHYSNEVLNAVQFSIDKDVNHEIQNYLSTSLIFNNISLSELHNPSNQFKIHFPCLDTVLNKLEASNEISTRVLEVIQMAISANPQTVRQVARSFILPISQRRAQLKSYLNIRFKALLTQKGYTPTMLKQFCTETQAKHSRLTSRMRDAGKFIQATNIESAKVSTNEYKKGRSMTEGLVHGIQLCTEEAWDARSQVMEKSKWTSKRNLTRAMTKR